ncbi:MAG TPA: hypothetical protein VF097_03885 [Actinomycetota bacterium]
MGRSRAAAALLAIALSACGTAAPVGGPAGQPAVPPNADPAGPDWDSSRWVAGDPFRGFGAWVDVYDEKLWADPEGTVARIADRGARTLYLQTASTSTKRRMIRFPEATARFLDAARRRGVRTVAWYLPELLGAPKDLRRAVTAATFTTENGARFDGVALDIEATHEPDPLLRADRLLELSRQVRGILGSDYPLGAIVPSPIRGPDFWPVLPVAELAKVYDAILPMAYWTFHISGEDAAHGFISQSIRMLREEAGPEVPIHVIGGIADTSPGELRGFVRAVRDADVVGASVYDVDTTDERGWRVLQELG